MPRYLDRSAVGVEEAGRALGVSVSTVWRLIRCGALPSIRKGGRRLISKRALVARGPRLQKPEIPPFTSDHPIFRLAGAGRGGGNLLGASDKHAILDE